MIRSRRRFTTRKLGPEREKSSSKNSDRQDYVLFAVSGASQVEKIKAAADGHLSGPVPDHRPVVFLDCYDERLVRRNIIGINWTKHS